MSESAGATPPAFGPPILTVAQMREVDRAAMAAGVPGIVLMENAGRGVADVVRARARRRLPEGAPAVGPSSPAAVVAIVCGAGNNGGDGFVAARHLVLDGFAVRVLLAAPRTKVTGDAAVMLRALDALGSAGRGLDLVDMSGAADLHSWQQRLANADVIVDALFGTGLRAPLAGVAAVAVEAINESRALRVAVDVPSGLDADLGESRGICVRADVTVTMGAAKVGLVVDPAAPVGDVEVVSLGIPIRPPAALGPYAFGIDVAATRSLLPVRAPGAHKGSGGHLVVVAGSAGKTGAALLVARAAQRSGAGLVTVASTAAGQVALDAKVVEAMTVSYAHGDDAGPNARTAVAALLERPNVRALAIGPGIPTGQGMQSLVRDLAATVAIPLVIDADGLNALGDRAAEILAKASAPRILTPHPGEMARLMGTTTAAVQADRLGHARRLAVAARAIVVLKGARTVVVAPTADAYVSPIAEPALATGGTGDVLTGVIGALIVQGMDPLAAACAGVLLHGEAGTEARRAHGPTGVIAGDLPDAIATVRARWQ